MLANAVNKPDVSPKSVEVKIRLDSFLIAFLLLIENQDHLGPLKHELIQNCMITWKITQVFILLKIISTVLELVLLTLWYGVVVLLGCKLKSFGQNSLVKVVRLEWGFLALMISLILCIQSRNRWLIWGVLIYVVNLEVLN